MSPFANLTPRQREVFDFIQDKIVNRGYGPTVREIGDYFRISSPNGVMCHLKALEKKGLIDREPNMSRAIQLTEEPAHLRRVRIGLDAVAERLDERRPHVAERHAILRTLGPGERRLDRRQVELDDVVEARVRGAVGPEQPLLPGVSLDEVDAVPRPVVVRYRSVSASTGQ